MEPCAHSEGVKQAVRRLFIHARGDLGVKIPRLGGGYDDLAVIKRDPEKLGHTLTDPAPTAPALTGNGDEYLFFHDVSSFVR